MAEFPVDPIMRACAKGSELGDIFVFNLDKQRRAATLDCLGETPDNSHLRALGIDFHETDLVFSKLNIAGDEFQQASGVGDQLGRAKGIAVSPDRTRPAWAIGKAAAPDRL